VDAIGYQCLIDAAEVAVGAAGNHANGDEQKYMPPMWIRVSGRPAVFIGIG